MAVKVGMMDKTRSARSSDGHPFVMTEPHSESVRKQQG